MPFQPEEHWSVPWLLADRIARSGDRPLVARKSPLSGDWQEVSARAFGEEVAHVAAGLIGMGLEAGTAVGIMAHTSYDWFLLDMAIARAGLISVPIYETSSAEQVEWIVTDADVRVVITESGTLAELVRGAVAGIEQPVRVLALDADAITTIVQAGSGVSPSQVDQRSNALTVDDVYSIIYTSGTTGHLKGVELTHRNAVGIPYHGVRYLPGVLWGTNVRLLLFLPLAHVYARCLQLLSLAGEGVLGHTPDAKTLLPDLQSFAPSYILAVPRVLEKIYNAADAKAGSGAKLKLFRWAAKVAIAYSRALDTPQGPSRGLRRAHAMADRLVFRKIRGLMGPNARFIISGGGPLGQRLGHFYRGLGLAILEGYGLTETIGPVSVNTDWLNKIGTVGPPVCGNEIRIGEDEEIQVRGIGVFSTYHNNPSATAEAFTTDGWFRTGDIGALDEDGYLRITGRKKELIVTAGGKNVAPAQLEDRLRGHPLISQVLVIGDGEPFISALITLDKEMLPQWLR
ncbi:MAG: AMP-dependent synthetase/ligase, partial [Actinomyces sp.]